MRFTFLVSATNEKQAIFGTVTNTNRSHQGAGTDTQRDDSPFFESVHHVHSVTAFRTIQQPDATATKKAIESNLSKALGASTQAAANSRGPQAIDHCGVRTTSKPMGKLLGRVADETSATRQHSAKTFGNVASRVDGRGARGPQHKQTPWHNPRIVTRGRATPHRKASNRHTATTMPEGRAKTLSFDGSNRTVVRRNECGNVAGRARRWNRCARHLASRVSSVYHLRISDPRAISLRARQTFPNVVERIVQSRDAQPRRASAKRVRVALVRSPKTGTGQTRAAFFTPYSPSAGGHRFVGRVGGDWTTGNGPGQAIAARVSYPEQRESVQPSMARHCFSFGHSPKSATRSNPRALPPKAFAQNMRNAFRFSVCRACRCRLWLGVGSQRRKRHPLHQQRGAFSPTA